MLVRLLSLPDIKQVNSKRDILPLKESMFLAWSCTPLKVPSDLIFGIPLVKKSSVVFVKVTSKENINILSKNFNISLFFKPHFIQHHELFDHEFINIPKENNFT